MIIKNGLIEMKKGYWVSLYFKIDNQENLKKYSELATPIIKSYGGVPLIRGGKHETFDGDILVKLTKQNEVGTKRLIVKFWSI